MKHKIEELREDYDRRIITAERSKKELHLDTEAFNRINIKAGVYRTFVAELSKILNSEAPAPAEVEVKNKYYLINKINIEDIPADVFEKLEGATVKHIVVYIHYLHTTIKSYNTALEQLEIHLPKTAKK